MDIFGAMSYPSHHTITAFCPQRLDDSALIDIPYTSSAGNHLHFSRTIRRLSLRPVADLKELFRPLIFNLLIDNTDDHLKNLGMLYAENGHYLLSPAFDIVPQLTHLPSAA